MNEPYSAKPWLRQYPAGWPADLKPAFTSVPAALDDALHHCPNQAALHYFGRALSYAELDAAAGELAGWASAQGVAIGDRVSIILQNVPGVAISTIAAWKLGAIPVPGNPMYKEAELSRIFADCTPRLLVCHPEQQDAARRALDGVGLTSTPILLVDGSDGGGAVTPASLKTSAATDGPRLADVIAGSSGPYSRFDPQPGDIGLMLYTSGTTGVPKAAMLRHDSIAFNAEAMGKWCEVVQGGRVLGLAPLFHITGFVSAFALAIVAKAALILHHRFDAAIVLDTIRRDRPTFTVGAITAFNALLHCEDVAREDFATFQRVYSGGAAIAPALRDTIEERLGITIHNCYGMTETCSPTHGCPPDVDIPIDPVSGALSIGVPTFSTEARVVDMSGEPVPAGTLGEIWMRGPQIMTGYWNKPDESDAALHDGWMRSGDVGFMDEEGWFYIVDRQKDMINASGFKVWPREVEDALHAHPAVREAAVVGAPDPYRGETVIAFVSLRTGVAADEQALVAHCRERLAAYKSPRRVHILPDLPKTPTGKIQRNILRAELAARTSQE